MRGRRSRSAPRRRRPGQGHAGPSHDLQDRQLPAQRAGLQPARAPRRATCSGRRGPTTPATRSSRRRTPRARSVTASVLTSCSTLATLDQLEQRQPAAGNARSTCSTRSAADRPTSAPTDQPERGTPRSPAGVRANAEAGPNPGPLLVMAGFALSCFGLLLFLWLAFGGPIPLQAQGLSASRRPSARPRSSPRRPTCASPACRWARSGRSRPRPTAARRPSSSSSPRYAPMPKNTKAILRQKTLLGETYVELTPGDRSSGSIARGRHAAGVERVADTVELDEIFRAFDKPTRRRSRTGCRPAAVSLRRAAARTSTTRSATWRRSPRTPQSCSRCSTRRPAACASSCATRARSSTRCPSATTSCAR